MLWLARHGETQANATGLLQGRQDWDLTERGRRQAKLLAAALPSDPLRVICSPLTRAQDTASAYGHPYEVDERWCEISFGSWEGESGKALLGSLWRNREVDEEWAPPSGESLPAVGRRVFAALAELVELAGEGDVVVFTHVSPIKASVAWALEASVMSAGRMHLDVASITRIAVGGGLPRLLGFNDTAHLRAEPGLLTPTWQGSPFGPGEVGPRGDGAGRVSPPGPGTGGRGG